MTNEKMKNMLVSMWRKLVEVMMGEVGIVVVMSTATAAVEVLSWIVGERSHSAVTGSSRHRGPFLLFFFVTL